MTKEEKISLFCQAIELDPENRVDENTRLASLEDWDSLALVSIIAMISQEFNREIPGDDIIQFETIGDILRFMEKEN